MGANRKNDMEISKLKRNNHMIWLSVIFLCGIGLIMVYSSSSYECASSAKYNFDSTYFVKKQAQMMAVGFLLAFVAQYLNYKLLEYNLIENVGKADLPGRPTMYSTTENFLKMFGIYSLEELPDLPRYKLDENEQIVIEDVMNEQEKSKVNSTDSNTQENTDEIQMEAPMPERENEDVIKEK